MSDKSTNLLLICASGITTGLLVRNMQKAADAQKLPVRIYSAPSITVYQVLRDQKIDGILIGPHIESEIDDIKDVLENKGIPYSLIDREDYELLDGNAALETAKGILDL